jgi:hypothetical protein
MDQFLNKNFLIQNVIIFLVILFLFSCNGPSHISSSFVGEEKTVKLAEQMFESIGGKAAWCELKSLYIRAEHTEPLMSSPYTSEIWRGIEKFELVIEQQNDSFHVKGVFNDLGGTIRYYDNRDTFRVLNSEQLEGWKFENNHNVYVLLHKFGCNPQDYKVKMDKESRLVFYKDSTLFAGVGLDDQLRPFQFYTPNQEGEVSGSVFTHWGEDEGLIHSAGGHPIDSSFTYLTEKWVPSNKALRIAFGENLFEIE